MFGWGLVGRSVVVVEVVLVVFWRWLGRRFLVGMWDVGLIDLWLERSCDLPFWDLAGSRFLGIWRRGRRGAGMECRWLCMYCRLCVESVGGCGCIWAWHVLVQAELFSWAVFLWC